MADLPLNEPAMPMNDDLEELDEGQTEEEEDAIDKMLQSAIRGGHFIVLPPNVPAPDGVVKIIPLPSPDFDDMDSIFSSPPIVPEEEEPPMG